MNRTLPENYIDKILGRTESFFTEDLHRHETQLNEIVKNSRFLIIGGAGTIGQSVTKEIFKRSALQLDVIDISENNLAELVRDIRCTFAYATKDFRTFCFDSGTPIFDAFIADNSQYDYILNLSALKHVRSERDPYTLSRLLQVNIVNTKKSIDAAIQCNAKKYFAVSSDKATNPANLMGASKRIMEYYLEDMSAQVPTSTARFANVAFSDGSLPFSFLKRIEKRQPLAAPSDILRYFITPQESGQLCLLSCLLGENRDIFIPKLENGLIPKTFSSIATELLSLLGYSTINCDTEEEAIAKTKEIDATGKWPTLFSGSDTGGEKSLEEFSTDEDSIDTEKYDSITVIKQAAFNNTEHIDKFETYFTESTKSHIDMTTLVDTISQCVPELNHKKSSKNLDQKM